VQLVEASGGSAAQLFNAAQVPWREDASSDYILDGASYSKLYSAATRLHGDECFGFLGPGRFPSGTFSIFCEYLLPARTLGEALERAAGFFTWMQKLQHRSAELKPHIPFTTDDELATLYFIGQSSSASRVFITQRAIASGLSSWLAFLDWLTGMHIPLLQIQLQGRCQLDEQKYQHIFKAPLHFQQQSNACVISAQYLQAPIVHTQQTLEDFLRQAPYHLVGRYERDSMPDSLSNQIKQMLDSDAAGKWPNLDQIAQTLEMTAHKMRQELEKEGCNFQTVKDEARLLFAFKQLHDHQIALDAIAHGLGFEETSAFERAFGKWAGLSPQRYRALLT
jgi:AraC-like DNA-binding protein